MEAIRATPEIKRGRSQLMATVVLGHFIKHIYGSGFRNIILPEIKIGLGLSATQLGTLAFSRQITGWFTTVGAGYLGDRFAHRAALMLGISLSLMGVGHFFAGSAPSYGVMVVAMLVMGIGPALYHPPAIGALSRRFPDRRGFAISLHGTGGIVGEVLGPLVTAGTLSLLVWQDVLRVSMIPALLGALVVWGMMRSVRGGAPGTSSTRAYLASLASLMKKRALFGVVLVTALASTGQGAINVFLPVYLREDLEYSAARVALYLSLAQVVGIGAQPAMGFLSDRFGRKLVLVPGLASLGLLFLALNFAEPGVQLLLTIVAMGAFLYPLHVIFIAAAIDVTGEQVQSTVVSLIYSAQLMGTISPILAGVIADSYGTPSAFLYGGAVVLLSALAMVLLRLPRTADQAAKSPGH